MTIMHGSQGSGYSTSMLALVVLVPIAIMVVACLMERFEASAVPATRPARTSRADLRASAATPAPAPASAPTSALATTLSLVPGTGHEDEGTVLPEPTESPAAPLRHAS